MPRVTIIPVIGTVTQDRLHSLTGCHAMHERAVTRSYHSIDQLGIALTESLREIALAEASGRRVPPCIDEMTYLVKFRV